MIDPASAFCLGVYFLGVGVVGSVLYIPVSLMRAIEHYHVGYDRKGNRKYLLEEEHLNNSESDSSMFHERPELLLIHKKKILRDILYDNNYLSNMDFDDRSDIHYHDKLTSYASDFDKRSSGKQLPSLHSSNMSRDVLSTTTPSEEDDNEPEIVVEDESMMLSLKYFKQFSKKKSTSQSNLFCSSTNSTSSLISLDATTSSVSNSTRRYQLEPRVNYSCERFPSYTGTKQLSSSNLLRFFHKGEFQQSTVIDEISAVHDIIHYER